MNTFWLLVVVSALAVVSCDDGNKDAELAAVRKKLQMFELLQKFLAAVYASDKRPNKGRLP
uniref:U31-Eretoxin-Ek1q_1 n=1 Tax=Eresus cinnaberinus TaxID=175337 RepID=A0A2D0PCU2_ERECI